MHRALFLDRDGIINDLVYYPSTGEYESPRTVKDLRICEGVVKALQIVAESEWKLFIVSNQPSHAKGKTSFQALREIQEVLERMLEQSGIRLGASYYCYHHPQGIIAEYSGTCVCRKPSPHFLLEASHSHDIDLSRSWMIGDQDLDMECGIRAGCHTAMIHYPLSASKRGKVQPEMTFTNLEEFVLNLTRKDVEWQAS